MNINSVSLRQEQMNSGRLYADRHEMIRSFRLPPGPIIAEVGVASGNFSDFLLRTLMPSKFVAIDLFAMEKIPVHWGVPQEVLFKGLTHIEFYRSRFSSYKGIVFIEQGLSYDCLNLFPDNYFDLLYIDADHEYESVKKDANAALRKIKPNGIIVFNDYVLYDPFTKSEYGVVHAVNELLQANSNYQVIGFAFNTSMFCDLAIQRVGK